MAAGRCHPSWSPLCQGKDRQRYQPYELRLSFQVVRHGCLRNQTYHVLSKEEGEEEVRRWHQRFLSLIEG